MREKSTGSAQRITAVIMTLFFLSPTISAISPVMSSISVDYPDVSAAVIGYVMTVTAATQAATAVITGAIAGKLVRFKPLLVAAAFIYTIAGCLPFFLRGGSDFSILLASRALLGVGLGIIMPLSNATILAFFSSEETRAKLIGRGNLMLNVGTVVTNFIGSVLCAVSWQTSFLVYGLGVVLVVLSITWMQEPEATTPDAVSHNASKRKLPAITFLFVVVFLLNVVLTQPAIVYNSQLLTGAGMPSPVLAAVMIALFSVGGGTMSAVFPRLFGSLRNALLPAAFFISALGLGIVYVGSLPEVANVAVYAVGITLVGVGLLATTCFTPLAISLVVAPEMQATAMGFVSFAMAIGTFLSTPFAQIVSAITGSSAVGTILFAAAACCAIAGIALVPISLLLRKSRS